MCLLPSFKDVSQLDLSSCQFSLRAPGDTRGEKNENSCSSSIVRTDTLPTATPDMTSLETVAIQKRPLPLPTGLPDPLTSRKFIKKTARGKILRVARERYLRDDISCGSLACPECRQISKKYPELPTPCLSSHGIQDNRSVGLGKGHYILLDTNVILHQMDLLESMMGVAPASSSSKSPSDIPSFINVIILQTVLDEVRHRSLPLYNRLMDIVKDSEHAARMGRSGNVKESRSWWVYYNDFSR